MTRLACTLALAAGLMATARAQPGPGPVFGPQDLTVSMVLGGLSVSGDMAVDGQGNLWTVSTQGAVGGTNGRLDVISPLGAVNAGAVTGLAEASDLIRGNDGNIYFWMNTGGGNSSLMRVTPGGNLSQVTTVVGGRALSIAQDAGGLFYVGYAAGNGIFQLEPATGVFLYHSVGIVGGDNRHLAFDAAGSLYVGDATRILKVPPSGMPTVVHQPLQPVCPGCSIDLPDFDQGHHAGLLVASRYSVIASTAVTTYRSVKDTNRQTELGIFPAVIAGGHEALARGISGDYYVFMIGRLYRLIGTPAILTFGLGTNQATVDVDGPPGQALVAALDAPGLNFPSAFGTFHTSLGTLPTFVLLDDGVGVFLPANPAAVTPWTAAYPLGPLPLNVQFTLEAYVLSNAATNGQFLITNSVTISL